MSLTSATLLAAAAILALSGCSDGDGESKTPAPPGEPPPSTVAPSPTASSTMALERGDFVIGDPITAATASIPAARDGRNLQAVAGYGEEILLEAERRVLPSPGEVVGQGPNRYDQHFLLWNPTTNSFREAWRNESERIETVYDIGGDWALSLLYRNNPGSFWILRIRNLETGEVRDIDAERVGEPSGQQYPESPGISDGRVVFTRLAWSGNERTSEVRVYDIGATAWETVDAAKYPLDDMANGSVIGSSSIDGDLVAWSRQGKLGTAIETVIRNTRTGEERIFSDIKVGQCQLVEGAAWLACDTKAALRGAAGSPIVSVYVRLADSRVFPPAADGVPYFHSWNGWFQLWVGAGGPARFSIIQPEALQVRVLDAPNAGQTPRLIDGWFTWREFETDSEGSREWTTLNVLSLN